LTVTDPKDDLQRYLQRARDALLWKLDGLSEYDIRRPLVPTGTNLLGLVKHVAGVEAGYLGDTFGRPSPEKFPDVDAEPNSDAWATADESREDITGLYRRVWAHSDATIEALPLDAIGHVPWWPMPHSEVTLHRILVHMIAETDRHAGHAHRRRRWPARGVLQPARHRLAGALRPRGERSPPGIALVRTSALVDQCG
jgi:hypothetical protein